MNVYVLRYDDGSEQYSEIIGVFANTNLVEDNIFDLGLERSRVKVESFILIE